MRFENLLLPKPYLLKLKHIAEHTPDSMQQFCLSVLLPAIDEKTAALTTNKGISYLESQRR